MTARLSDPTVNSDFDYRSPPAKMDLLRYLHHELTNDDREHISALAAAKAIPMYLVEAGYMVVMFRERKTGNLFAVITDPVDMSLKTNASIPSGTESLEVRLWIVVIEALLVQGDENPV